MKPLVGIVMGSASDWETVSRAATTLETLCIAHDRIHPGLFDRAQDGQRFSRVGGDRLFDEQRLLAFGRSQRRRCVVRVRAAARRPVIALSTFR